MGLSVIPAAGKSMEGPAGAAAGKAPSGFLAILASEVSVNASASPVSRPDACAQATSVAPQNAPSEEARAPNSSISTENVPTPDTAETVETSQLSSQTHEDQAVEENGPGTIERLESTTDETCEASEVKAPASEEAPANPDSALLAFAAIAQIKTSEPQTPSEKSEDGDGQGKKIEITPGLAIQKAQGDPAAGQAVTMPGSDAMPRDAKVLLKSDTKIQQASSGETEELPHVEYARPTAAAFAESSLGPAKDGGEPESVKADALPDSGIFVEAEAPLNSAKPEALETIGKGPESAIQKTAHEAAPKWENDISSQPRAGSVIEALSASGNNEFAVEQTETISATTAKAEEGQAAAPEAKPSEESQKLAVDAADERAPFHKRQGMQHKTGWRLWPKSVSQAKPASSATAISQQAAPAVKAAPQTAISNAAPVKAAASRPVDTPAKQQKTDSPNPFEKKLRAAEEAPRPGTAGEARTKADSILATATEIRPESELSESAAAPLSQAAPTEQKVEVQARRTEPTPELREAKEILRQVQGPLRVAFLARGEKAVIQLMPEALGKVHVEISRTSQGMAANFRVETVEAKEALTSQVVQLQKGFEGRGVNLVSVNVELGNDRSAGNGGQAKQGKKGKPHQHLAGRIETDTALSAESTWKPWGFETRA